MTANTYYRKMEYQHYNFTLFHEKKNLHTEKNAVTEGPDKPPIPEHQDQVGCTSGHKLRSI